jgi:hypothetical protein
MAEHGHESHGNTIAAWSCVGLLMVAAFIMCLAVVLASWIVFVVGAVVAVIGLAVGKLLSLAGYGAPRPSDQSVPADAH